MAGRNNHVLIPVIRTFFDRFNKITVVEQFKFGLIC